MIICDNYHLAVKCFPVDLDYNMGQRVYCRNCGSNLFYMICRDNKIYKLEYEGLDHHIIYECGLGKVIYYHEGRRSNIEKIIQLELNLELEPSDITVAKLVKRVELKINKFMNFQ